MKETLLKWRSHLPNLLIEIVEGNPTAWTLRIPILLTREILTKVAERAIEIDDPKLNVLMLRLSLYDVAPDKITEAIDAQEQRPVWSKVRSPVGDVENTRLDIADLERACVCLGEVRVLAAGSMYATIETDAYMRSTLVKHGVRFTEDR